MNVFSSVPVFYYSPIQPTTRCNVTLFLIKNLPCFLQCDENCQDETTRERERELRVKVKGFHLQVSGRYLFGVTIVNNTRASLSGKLHGPVRNGAMSTSSWRDNHPVFLGISPPCSRSALNVVFIT